MRYRLPLFAPLLLSLLVACSKNNAGPRLDLVGSSRYTSYDRTITTPGDTVTFKLYADVRDADKPLRHVRIFVTYTPTKYPIDYATGYDPKNPPADPNGEFTYLDSAMSAKEFVLQTTLTARTTSGREQWRFEAEDADGNKVSRGFRLQLRNSDSTRVYHSYTAQLQAPNATGNRRSFLALRPGLTLPYYTVRTNAQNQSIVDLVYVATKNGIYLAAPNDTITHLTKHQSWPNRATEFRNTNLAKANFLTAVTGSDLTSLFTNAVTPSATRTDPIAKEKVYAFKTKDEKFGLIYVDNILTAPVPTVLLQVRIMK